MPHITALITTYNRSLLLKRAIESVLTQTYRDFELIILDNSSNDNTRAVVEIFLDRRIRYIIHPPATISEARNLGVREARGQYIAFLDDDDEWLSNKLESQLSMFKRTTGLGLVYSGFQWVSQEGRVIGEHIPRVSGFVFENLLSQQDPFTGSASNPLLPKQIINEFGGYDEEIRTGEDWDLYVKITARYPVACIPQIGVRIHQHSGVRLGDNLLAAAVLEEKILCTYTTFFDRNLRLKSFYLQKIGGKFVRCRRGKEGRAYLCRALRVNPFNFIALGQYILSFFGSTVYGHAHKRFFGALYFFHKIT